MSRCFGTSWYLWDITSLRSWCNIVRFRSHGNWMFNTTTTTGPNGRKFVGNIFTCVFVKESFVFPLNVVDVFTKSTDNKYAFVQVMAWRWICDKALSEPTAAEFTVTCAHFHGPLLLSWFIPRSHTRIFLTIPYGSPNRSQSQASVNNTLRSVYNSSQLGNIRNKP